MIFPAGFKNIIFSENDRKIIVRSNLQCMTHINDWVQQFGVLNNIKWNCRDSVPKGKQMMCMKSYVCQHSSFHKVPRSKIKRTVSKNADCTATIHIKIKLCTVNTLRKDEHMKEGLWAIITISKNHSHAIKPAQSLQYLQKKSQETARISKELEECTESKYIVIPVMEQPRNEKESIEITKDSSDLINLTATAFDILHEKIKTLGSSATVENLERFIVRLREITTERQLETFLSACSVSQKKNSKHGTIRVESISIARRKPNVIKGCKRLAEGRKGAVNEKIITKRKPQSSYIMCS